MYLRFITQHITETEETTRGFFQTLDYVENHYLTLKEDKEILAALHSWFRKNLDAPDWFKNPTGRQHEYHSLSWFKDSAKEHIQKIYEIAVILEKYDLIVERVTTKRPGRIVYEDEYQISAVPFSIDRKKVI